MHSGSLIPLAVFIFLSGLQFAIGQDTSSPARQAPKSEIQIRVPTKLRIERTPGVVKVEVNRDSLESVKLTIDEGMVIGVKDELRVYPAGKSRPALPQRSGVTEGTDFNLGVDSLNANDRNFPVPNKKYAVEMTLTVFETDLHPRHTWRPLESRKYKVLLQRTLVGSVD
jgi:hypothetical protein